MLAKLNIETIVIEEENKLSPEELEDIFQKRQVEVAARFERVADLPQMTALKKAIIDHARRARDEALAAIIPESPETPEIPETPPASTAAEEA
jgi:hypothetical protein